MSGRRKLAVAAVAVAALAIGEGYKYTRFRNGPSGRKFYPPEH